MKKDTSVNMPNTEQNQKQPFSGSVVGIQHDHLSVAKKPKKRFIIIGILVFVLVLAGAVYVNQNNESPSQPKETYTLSGTFKGRGMSFDRYNIFKEPISTKDLPSKVSFVQTEKSGDKTVNIANLSAQIRDMSKITSETTAGGPSPEFANSLRKRLALDPNSDDYKLATRTINGFVKSSFSNEVVVTLGPAKPYTNESIKTDAWQFEVAIVGNSFDGILPQKGSVVIAIGQSSYYYYLVTGSDNNWNNNSEVFNNIINSLKIDQ